MPLTDTEKLEHVRKTYDRQQDLAGRGDTKAGLLLAAHTVVGYTLIEAVSKAIGGQAKFSSATMVLLCGCGGLFALSFTLSTLVLIGRGGNGTALRTEGSVLFFKHQTTPEAYVKVLEHSSTEALIQDYASNIVDLSQVVVLKFRLFKAAAMIFLIAVASWIACLVSLALGA